MSRHLIYKQKVTMNLPRREEAFAFQKRVSDFFQYQLNDSLEHVLDQAFPPDKIVRIDSLSLDLGNINAQNFEQEFKARFVEALIKSLASKKDELNIAGDEENVTNNTQSLVNSLIFFLEKGYLPWYSAVKKKADWETEMRDKLSEREYKYFLDWLRANYKESPVIVERLVLQFSDHFIGELLSNLAPAFSEPWDLLFADCDLILNSIGDSIALNHRKKKKTQVQGPEILRSKFKRSVIRSKIWEYAFDVLLDQKVNDQAFNILKSLAQYFEFDDEDIILINENAISKNLKTRAVKQAFEKLVDSRINNKNDRKRTRGDSSQHKRFNENKGADAATENTKDISAKHKTNADSTAESTSSENSARQNQASGNNELPDTGGKDGAASTANKNQEQLKAATAAQTRNKKKHLPDTGDLIDVNNCGVVILHPFLKAYFADLNLLADSDFIDSEARARAVLLLNYLATGKADAAEFDLTLQKVLCGYPLEDTLEASIQLTDKEKTESDNLLNAVIDYWPPLKNTSIAGLRSTFLQRNGNLELKESGWLLKVEQKTVDILLGKLAWGFSTIRLPWMKKMLSVDWC